MLSPKKDIRTSEMLCLFSLEDDRIEFREETRTGTKSYSFNRSECENEILIIKVTSENAKEAFAKPKIKKIIEKSKEIPEKQGKFIGTPLVK